MHINVVRDELQRNKWVGETLYFFFGRREFCDNDEGLLYHRDSVYVQVSVEMAEAFL